MLARPANLPRVCERPYDWLAIDAEIEKVGAVVLKALIDAPLVGTLNADADAFLNEQKSGKPKPGKQKPGTDIGLPATGSETYDRFLGYQTVRLHGLLEKFPSACELMDNPQVLDWAARSLLPVATEPRLSAAEFIQIQPGEPRQLFHRDSDSWPLPVGEHPVVVNAIVALTEFSATNGATWVAPGSFEASGDHNYEASDFVQAVMAAGDALLFRGDLLHGAGANESDASRRAISLSFCAGWLRAVENSALNLKLETLHRLSPKLLAALGFAPYDGSARGNGLLGLYENGDPAALLKAPDT